MPLAADRVFYAGQPVVAIIAESEAAAQDAAALVEIVYEELQPAVEPVGATRDDAPLVLEDSEGADESEAAIHGVSAARETASEDMPRNVTDIAHLTRGDAAGALKKADIVVSGTYRLAGVHQSFIEPHVSMVRPEPDGGLTIWSPTQGPFAVRNDIAKLIGVRVHQVRVIPMPVGGGFGGKVELLEPLLALLALRVRRPVRLVLSRSHEFVVGHPAPAATVELELGARRDGTLVALRARFQYDNGASSGWHAGGTANFLAGTYRIPNFDVEGMEVATNKTPVDAYRAPGAQQGYFALESAMDELAARSVNRVPRGGEAASRLHGGPAARRGGRCRARLLGRRPHGGCRRLPSRKRRDGHGDDRVPRYQWLVDRPCHDRLRSHGDSTRPGASRVR
jgi:CO/xanthine dehydrogenase Mo-binding subunit